MRKISSGWPGKEFAADTEAGAASDMKNGLPKTRRRRKPAISRSGKSRIGANPILRAPQKVASVPFQASRLREIPEWCRSKPPDSGKSPNGTDSILQTPENLASAPIESSRLRKIPHLCQPKPSGSGKSPGGRGLEIIIPQKGWFSPNRPKNPGFALIFERLN
jgi:hypothetical protein